MIGRGPEQDAVAHFLDRVPDGPVALVIEGEPGIGKTTIWLETLRRADERGYRVLRARPAEGERELSFATLADLIGGVLGEVAAELPQPQRDALDAALLKRGTDQSIDPRTTGTGVVTILTALAAERPVIVAIDDAQWLDRASERALEFAARRLPARLGVVVARRSDVGGLTPLGLDRVLQADAIERLTLEPLSLAALHHVVERAGAKLSRPMLVRVAEASGGNPFYALEITRALGSGAFEVRLGDPLPIPPVLVDLVRGRLARLSGPARTAALAAAALARPSRATIAAALDPNMDADSALLEAEEAGVLVWDDDRLRFGHPLLASALSGTLTTGRRRALHRRLADAVANPEERARHLARSIVTPNAETAQVIEDAAALAARRGAPDAAAELFEAACRLTPEGDAEARARRLLGGADALGTAGDLQASRRLAEDALAAAPSGRLRARVLVLLGSLATYTGTMEERIAAHEAALAEVDDDPRLRAQILVALGEQVTIDPRRAAQRADEAAPILRDLGDTAGLTQALMYRLLAGAVLGQGAPKELVDEVAALETAAPGRRTISLIWSSWMDDIEATRERYRVQVELARDEGDLVAVAELAEFVAMVEFRAGDWKSAEERLEASCETLGQLDVAGPIAASLADRSLIDAHRGRIERARRTMRDIQKKVGPDRFWQMVCQSAVGEVEFIAGDLAAADEAWTQMRETAESLSWLEFLEDRSEPNHIEAMLRLGQRERALALLAHLEWRGRTLPRRWIDATLPRAQALVIAGEGRLQDALTALEAAPAVDRMPFERARLLMVKGQLERRANRKLAARDSLAQALSVFEQLGSPPWVARTRAEMDRLGLRHGAAHELTATERRIAELAATGMTNRQVAESAFVSPKTVEANLARIYGKLGIRSRAELGARMAADQRGPAEQT